MKKLIYELIGTLVLVFTIGTAVASGSVFAPLSIGCALMVMGYAGGHISGAHYNPAVSLAIFIRGKISGPEMFQYWIAQISGGLAGAFLSCAITGSDTCCQMIPEAEASRAVFAELIGTFILAFVVLNVATVKAHHGNSFYGLAIGFTIFALASTIGSISGGAYNPAVGISRCFCDMANGGPSLSNLWIYLVGPFAGATLAALVWNYCNDRKAND
ncbi:MAG: aquaporin [Flavobacteriales bacterium]|nr:aquaporin [Flavobacteriales bacterium]